jgi:hypothetical protein
MLHITQLKEKKLQLQKIWRGELKAGEWNNAGDRRRPDLKYKKITEKTEKYRQEEIIQHHEESG